MSRAKTVTCYSCREEIPGKVDFCPYCGSKIEPETRIAQEILKSLREIVALNVTAPTALKDDGTRGKTLESYRVGLARVRIAEEVTKEVANIAKPYPVKCLYLVDEPPLEAKEILAYAMVIYKLYTSAPTPPTSILRRGKTLTRSYEKSSDIETFIEEALKDVVAKLRLSQEQAAVVRYYVDRELVHYGILSVPMQDPDIEDISCTAPATPVHVIHRRYADYLYLETNIIFPNDDTVTDFMLRHAHRAGAGLTIAKPYSDFVLHDGSRFSGVIGSELTAEGPAFTIRRFPENPFSLPQLVAKRALSPLMAAYLWLALEARAIFGIAGPTGSGKTTLFSALLACLNPRAKVITIEDTFEIRIPHNHWLRMTTRRPAALVAKELEVHESELIDMAMRMRPNYLIVGEVRRDDSVYHLLKAAFSGHGGGFTFHAGSAEEFYSRLGLMLNRTGINEALLSFLWGCAITDHVETPTGRGRRVVEIAEILPNQSSQSGIAVEKVFQWEREKDTFSPNTAEEVVRRSTKLSQTFGASAVDELEKRARLIFNAAIRNMGLFEFANLVATEVYGVH